MVVKMEFSNCEQPYSRFVECDTLRCLKDTDSLKLLMYKQGKLVESPEFFCTDQTGVRISLIEMGMVIDSFKLNSNTELSRNNKKDA